MSVDRAPESRVCPDAQGILEAARRLFPTVRLDDAPSPGEATIGFSISVHPSLEGHEANIWVSGARTGERNIKDPDGECRGLAAAIALALVMIVDPDATVRALAERDPGQHDPAPGPAPPTNGDTNRSALAEDAALATDDALDARVHAGARASGAGRQADNDVLLLLDAGGLGGVGQLGTPAFGGFLGAAIGFRRGPGLRVRGSRLVALSSAVDPGTIHVDLWAALFGACWRFARPNAWSLYPCLDFGIGRQHAAARDVRQPGESVTRPFYALGPSLTGAIPLVFNLELTAVIGVAANLWIEDYLIDSVRRQGQARVSAFLGLGLSAAFDLTAHRPEVIRP